MKEKAMEAFKYLVFFGWAFMIALLLVLAANITQIVSALITYCLQDNGLMWIINIAVSAAATFGVYKYNKEGGYLGIIFSIIRFFLFIILCEFLIWHRDEIYILLKIVTVRDLVMMSVGIIISIAMYYANKYIQK